MNKKQTQKYVKDWGIGLVIAGILGLIFSFLSSFAGIIVIIIGIISLCYRNKNMMVVIGIILIIFGIFNIVTSILFLSFASIIWIVLGIAQIYWGIKELDKTMEKK